MWWAKVTCKAGGNDHDAGQDRAESETLEGSALADRQRHPGRRHGMGSAAAELHHVSGRPRRHRRFPRRGIKGAQIRRHASRIRRRRPSPRSQGGQFREAGPQHLGARELLHRVAALFRRALADLREQCQVDRLQRPHGRLLRQVRRADEPPDRARRSAVRQRQDAARLSAFAARAKTGRKISLRHRHRRHGRLQGDHVLDVRRQIPRARHGAFHL